MLKQKKNFKEEKKYLNLQKQKVDKLLDLNESHEDYIIESPSRGRQLCIKTIAISKQNIYTTSQGSEKTSTVSKSYKTEKRIDKSQQNKNNQKFSLSYSSTINEEYESSDSDLPIKNYTHRQLVCPETDYKSKLDSFFDEIEYYGENNEMANYLIYNFEKNLKIEIGKILIDIYNHNISSSIRKQKTDVTIYENKIKYFSNALNKQFDICILKIMIEKIKEIINKYKENVFEIEEIKSIRDRYYEYKYNIYEKKTDPNANTNYKSSEVEKKISVSSNVSPKRNLDKSNLNFEHQPIIKKKNKIERKNTDLNKSDKSIIDTFLLELRNIKQSLIDSSNAISTVFQVPMSNLRLNNKTVKFNIEEIHREEFVNCIIKDEFISDLMIQIKTISRELNIQEVNLLISQIEEDIYSNTKEMTRFVKFLSQIKSLNESDCEDEYFSNERSFSSDHYSQNVVHIQTNIQEEIPQEISKKNPNDKFKISNDIGLDELVEYIEKSDQKKIKKNRKKLKKKKNALDKRNSEMRNNTHITINNQELDEEIETFKKLLEESNKNSYSARKIKPLITKEWLSNIEKST